MFAFSPVPNGLVASFQGRREVITGQLASANMFDVLGIRAAVGRLFLAADDFPGAEPVAVLGYGYWLRAFGGARDTVGRSLILDNRAVTVVGILPRTFRGVNWRVLRCHLAARMADLFRAVFRQCQAPRQASEQSEHGLAHSWVDDKPGLVRTASGRRLEGFLNSHAAMIAPVPVEIRKR